ncbi:MAG: dihydropteroate synthase [Actinomycetota bacterium]|nr:dihydropteroate synthase [Actinomycetota bacterium]
MRALVMGVLNVTPDSFCDGGAYFDQRHAIARGLEMVAEGADIVDVGGESSRPGARPVPEAEEMRRVLPVIEQLAEHVRVSVDTAKPAVARAAVAAGATLINDISASLAEVAAACGTGWVAMHMKGTPRDMQNDPRYADVVVEVRDFLAERAAGARRRGVSEVWIDPGIGFGKTVVHNLSLLAHCGELADLGYPLLVGTSRKSFLGRLFPLADGSPAPPGERIEASVATAVWAAAAGAAMVRVHDVAATVQALTIAGGEPDGDKRPDAPPPALAATGRLA